MIRTKTDGQGVVVVVDELEPMREERQEMLSNRASLRRNAFFVLGEEWIKR